MDERNMRRVQRVGIRLLLALALVMAAVTWAVPNGGIWRVSGKSDCPGEKVCADWEIEEIEDWASCCIDPNQLDTTNLSACDSSFRHSHGGH